MSPGPLQTFPEFDQLIAVYLVRRQFSARGFYRDPRKTRDSIAPTKPINRIRKYATDTTATLAKTGKAGQTNRCAKPGCAFVEMSVLSRKNPQNNTANKISASGADLMTRHLATPSASFRNIRLRRRKRDTPAKAAPIPTPMTKVAA